MKVIAVVVTYNRKGLLKECLESILNQSLSAQKIIVVDNASTDGTAEMIRKMKSETLRNTEMIDYRLMKRNLGGSGGFYKGIELAKEEGADWIWIMDDDSIPETACLEELVNNTDNKISFLASCVYGIHNEPMNIPEIDIKPTKNGYPYWHERLSDGLILIKNATFVSILINREAVKKCGLPCKDYFIWGDDIEYTQRLVKYYGKAYFVGNSKVCHKRANAYKLDVRNEKNPDRIKNFSYYYRNNLVNIMLYESNWQLLSTIIRNMGKSFVLLCTTPYGGIRFLSLWKGLLCAVFFRHHVINFLNEQLKI